MSLGNSIRKGTKWLITGSVAERLIQFGFGIILARLLVPADFGMLVTMSIFTGLAGYVAGGGMGQALVQAKSVTDRHFHVVFTLQLGICLVIYSLFFVISPWFAEWYDTPLYEDLLRVSALTFLLRPFANIQNSRLHREMRFKAKAFIAFTSGLIGSIASVTMAFNDMGVWSLILGGLCGAIANNILLQIIARQSTRIAFDKQIVRTLGSYGIKVQSNNILIYLKGQTTNFIISVLQSPAFLGLYNKADSLNNIPRQTIMGATYQTVFRALAKEQENLDLSRYIYFRTITLGSVYTLPFYVGLWWLAEPFINFVYGTKWIDSAEALEVLAVMGLLLVANPSGAVIAARNRIGREIWLQLETFPVLIIGVLIGINWGLTGVAWAIVANHIYGSLRMANMALSCLKSGFRRLFMALAPSYLLNLILFIVLLSGDVLLFTEIRNTHPGGYLVGMTLLGSLTYAIAFLYMPISEIASEANRWKNKLKLTQL